MEARTMAALDLRLTLAARDGQGLRLTAAQVKLLARYISHVSNDFPPSQFSPAKP